MDASGIGGADDDVVMSLIVERDLWRRRANESELRWESFLTLEAERAELRQHASEMLTEDHLALMAERDRWRRRALNAETLVCADADNCIDLTRIEDMEAERDALVVERDQWRARALRAESSIARKNDHGETEGDHELEPPVPRSRSGSSWLD